MHKQKTMLITGTSKGIGKYLAEYYLDKKYTVVGCSRSDSNIANIGYKHFQLDIADEVAVKHMFHVIGKLYGRLDVLLNNAGIASMNHSLLMSTETARRILDTNLVGVFTTSRESVKLMKRNTYGRIVNFVTFAVPFKLEGEAIYAASKAGVITLTEILAREYADFGITVNAVSPPATKTNLISGVAADKMDKLLDRQAISRYGKLSDISNVIDFFIKSESEMVTGQVVYLGGV